MKKSLKAIGTVLVMSQLFACAVGMEKELEQSNQGIQQTRVFPKPSVALTPVSYENPTTYVDVTLTQAQGCKMVEMANHIDPKKIYDISHPLDIALECNKTNVFKGLVVTLSKDTILAAQGKGKGGKGGKGPKTKTFQCMQDYSKCKRACDRQYGPSLSTTFTFETGLDGLPTTMQTDFSGSTNNSTVDTLSCKAICFAAWALCSATE